VARTAGGRPHTRFPHRSMPCSGSLTRLTLHRSPGAFKSGVVTAGAGTVLRSLVLSAQVGTNVGEGVSGVAADFGLRYNGVGRWTSRLGRDGCLLRPCLQAGGQ
jgi:hypothetical protein